MTHEERRERLVAHRVGSYNRAIRTGDSMPISDLYKQIVLEHNRAPRNFGALPGHTHAADGVNASCGDALRCEAIVRGGRIDSLRFGGEACAITIATASLLSERVAGCDASAVATLAQRFEQYLFHADASDESLGELCALAELRRYPARIKCAQLPFATLLAALAGERAATTERAWEPLTPPDDLEHKTAR